MEESEIWFDRAVRAGGNGDHEAAERAWREVLARTPDRADAWLGLGLCLTSARRFVDAIDPLTRACRAPDTPPLWRLCLAQALYMAGRFGDSAALFAEVADLEPLEANARLTWARAAAMADMIDGSVEDALARYADIAGPQAEDQGQVASDAFAVLPVFGHVQSAIAVGRWLLARDPADIKITYALAALEKRSLHRAPAAYVEALFDGFADRFDAKLVDDLGYQAPRLMADLVALHRDRFMAILDLGCGTGLSAQPLSRFDASLVGVDLSGAMLEKARGRALYDELVQDDLAAFLPTRPLAFDLVFAADVLIYFGDLASVVAGVAAALRGGGFFAFSTELGADDWTLLDSGRFAHAPAYLHRLAGDAFDILDEKRVVLRREGSGGVDGLLCLWRRR
ncbi:MAG: methyltransferase domain-containing protein [Cupriavidus sp.]|nr:MAG: methyltransferase domain-containing protein [Cupriavidus sp.]